MQDNGIRSPIRQILMNLNTLKVKLDDLYSTRQKRLLKVCTEAEMLGAPR
jgi:pantothenate kinase-related protein Tda10